jgi:catechol 2,3-dioxygenase-like lactoylglutathione lyase family enzyme
MRIEHVAIWSKEIEILKQFYESHFGATSNKKYTNKTGEFESYFLSFDSGARLELMRMSSIPETSNDPHKQFTGLIHLALGFLTGAHRVTITRAMKALKKSGKIIFDIVTVATENLPQRSYM